MAANSLAMVLGDVAAGVLVGFTGYWPAFMIDALTFFISFGLVTFVAVAARGSTATAAGQSLWAMSLSVIRDLGAELALIVKTPFLWGSLIATGVMMLGLGSINVINGG